MLSHKLIVLTILPLVACLSVVEEIFLTRQLFQIFGDDSDEDSSEVDGGYDVKSAALLSPLSEKERADHYWTRRGHRNRERTTPPSMDYYTGYFPQYNRFGAFRKKRDTDLKQRIGDGGHEADPEVHESEPEVITLNFGNSIQNRYNRKNL